MNKQINVILTWKKIVSGSFLTIEKVWPQTHVKSVHDNEKGTFLLLPLLPTRLKARVKSPHVHRSTIQLWQPIKHFPRQISPVVHHFGQDFLRFLAKNGLYHQTNQFFDRIPGVFYLPLRSGWLNGSHLFYSASTREILSKKDIILY